MVKSMTFSHGLRVPTDADSGEPTVNCRRESLDFTKAFDRASPYLLKACCPGQSLRRAVIHLFEIDSSSREIEYFRRGLKGIKVATSDRPCFVS